MVFGFTNIETVDKEKEPSMEVRNLIMNRWKIWMDEMGDLLLDMGSPLVNGKAITSEGVQKKIVSNLAGYMKIKAKDFEHAMALLNKSPLFDNGHAQNYELFECIM